MMEADHVNSESEVHRASESAERGGGVEREREGDRGGDGEGEGEGEIDEGERERGREREGENGDGEDTVVGTHTHVYTQPTHSVTGKSGVGCEPTAPVVVVPNVSDSVGDGDGNNTDSEAQYHDASGEESGDGGEASREPVEGKSLDSNAAEFVPAQAPHQVAQPTNFQVSEIAPSSLDVFSEVDLEGMQKLGKAWLERGARRGKVGTEKGQLFKQATCQELLFSEGQLRQIMKEDKLQSCPKDWCLAGSAVLNLDNITLYHGATSSKSCAHGKSTSILEPVIDVGEAKVSASVEELNNLLQKFQDPEMSKEISGNSRLELAISTLVKNVEAPTNAELFPGAGGEVPLNSSAYHFPDLRKLVTKSKSSFIVDPKALNSVQMLHSAHENWKLVIAKLNSNTAEGFSTDSPRPSSLENTKQRLLDEISSSEMAVTEKVQRIHDECWKKVLALLNSVQMWSLGRQSLADSVQLKIKECDLQQDSEFVPAAAVISKFIEKAEAIKNKPEKDFEGSFRAFKSEVDMKRCLALEGIMAEWEAGLVAMHAKWTDSFIADFAPARLTELEHRTTKLIETYTKAESNEHTFVDVVAKTAAAEALASMQSKFDKVLNSIRLAHQTRLLKVQAEIASCNEHLSGAGDYTTKKELLSDKDFKRKLKKIENSAASGRSDGIQRLVKTLSDPAVLICATTVMKYCIMDAKMSESQRLNELKADISIARTDFEARVDLMQRDLSKLKQEHQDRLEAVRQDALIAAEEAKKATKTKRKKKTKKSQPDLTGVPIAANIPPRLPTGTLPHSSPLPVSGSSKSDKASRRDKLKDKDRPNIDDQSKMQITREIVKRDDGTNKEDGKLKDNLNKKKKKKKTTTTEDEKEGNDKLSDVQKSVQITSGNKKRKESNPKEQAEAAEQLEESANVSDARTQADEQLKSKKKKNRKKKEKSSVVETADDPLPAAAEEADGIRRTINVDPNNPFTSFSREELEQMCKGLFKRNADLQNEVDSLKLELRQTKRLMQTIGGQAAEHNSLNILPGSYSLSSATLLPPGLPPASELTPALEESIRLQRSNLGLESGVRGSGVPRRGRGRGR